MGQTSACGWPDGGPWSTGGKWTQRRAAPAHTPIPDLTWSAEEDFKGINVIFPKVDQVGHFDTLPVM